MRSTCPFVQGWWNFGRLVFNAMLRADTIKDMLPCPLVLLTIGKLDAVISEDPCGLVRHNSDKVTEKLSRLYLTVLFL